MKTEPETKCSKAGFQHSWRDITDNIVYPTMPPQYPPKKEQCINCGLTRTHYQKTENWVEYKQGDLPESIVVSSITLTK